MFVMRSGCFFILLFVLFVVDVFGQTEKISTTSGEFSFEQFASNIIKVTYQPRVYSTNENISDAVILKPYQQKNSKIKSSDATQQSIFFSKNRIDFNAGKCYFGADKKIVLSDVFQREGYKGFQFKLQSGEQVFGGGERALSLNRRGYKFPLYNNPWYGYSEGADALNFSVPFFTSSKGYGLFFDNASKGYVDIGKTNADIFEVGFISGELNFYLIMGKDYKEILSSYYQLTGTQPIPPRWAMGNFMSRFGYSSNQQVNDILGKMQANQVPVDAIIFDLYWFGDSIKGTLGNLDWVNKKSWPNPQKMIGDFMKKKINTILIAEPFILRGTKNYIASQKYLTTDSTGKPFELTDFYFGYGGLLDIFRKDAGDWIWKNHYKKQIANGVTGWWTDLGEPEKHPAAMMHNFADWGIKRLLGADEVHNAYGHYWNKMLFTNYKKEFPEKRLFHLNRSGFAGSQRYSIFPWSGDISRNWSGLRAQLPVMLGMSMSGVPYIHADAGGFAGGTGDNELYVRWLQFAAFTPIFRPHGTALYELDKSAFSFPSEPALIAEPYRSYAKSVINFRYALLPYNYTLAYNQAAAGEPLVAPLYYHYPTDSLAIKVEDEFMWGANILVAPILQEGETERKIYLPEGAWYPFNFSVKSNTHDITGQSWINVKTAMEEIPVFVKAGSFIPMILKPNGVNTKEYKTDSLTVHYFVDKHSSQYTLFDDDGTDNRSLKLNRFELLNFKANISDNGLLFKFSSNGGGFTGRPVKRNIRLLVHGLTNPEKYTFINGKKGDRLLPVYNTEGQPTDIYYFSFDFTGKPITIDIK
jgi:oligosaccharide 4-alpha-D-glucosyltransferase